jgi:hypothetical protein
MRTWGWLPPPATLHVLFYRHQRAVAHLYAQYFGQATPLQSSSRETDCNAFGESMRRANLAQQPEHAMTLTAAPTESVPLVSSWEVTYGGTHVAVCAYSSTPAARSSCRPSTLLLKHEQDNCDGPACQHWKSAPVQLLPTEQLQRHERHRCMDTVYNVTSDQVFPPGAGRTAG